MRSKSCKPNYLYLDVTGRKEYLEVMAGVTGQSMTKYVQALIDADMEKNGKTYEAAMELIRKARE